MIETDEDRNEARWLNFEYEHKLFTAAEKAFEPARKRFEAFCQREARRDIEESLALNDFHMFSDQGNAAVKKMIDDLPADATKAEVIAFLRQQMEAIDKQHGEVGDTDVREIIVVAAGRKTGARLSIFDI